MNWKNNIAGSFGSVDLIFANHPSDAERAINLLLTCYKEGVSYQDLEKEIRNYLSSEGASSQHIKEQMNNVHLKFKSWLAD